MVNEFDPAIKAILANIFNDNDQSGPVALAFMNADICGIDQFIFFDPVDVKEMEYNDGVNIRKLTQTCL